MQRMILAAATALVSVSFAPAFAQDRMSMSEYLAASKCIAHVELSQLSADAPNIDALRAAARYSARTLSEPVRAEARSRKRTLQRDARRGRISTEQLRADRDEACAQFVASGLVQR